MREPSEFLKDELTGFELFPVASKEEREYGMWLIESAMTKYAEAYHKHKTEEREGEEVVLVGKDSKGRYVIKKD